MFQDEYRRAYDQIEISKINVDELQKGLKVDMKAEGKCFRIIRPIAVPILSMCLLCILTLPVLAEQIPVVYQVIQRFAPNMAEYILPEEVICTSNGITLQAEAVNIEGNVAEIILSFKDAEESEKDQICGRVDLYDSYRILNYGEAGQIGGCSFLGYDSIEDKAYFKVDITSNIAFQKDKVKIVVNQLLTRHEGEEQEINLEKMIEDPEEKIVESSGISGVPDKRSEIPFFITDTSRTVRIMDVAEQNATMAEELSVTGVAYDEGVLRVQQCRGSFQNADRHIRFYLKDNKENERIPDVSVTWQEEINGEKVLFEETWFLIPEQELEKYELFGVFYITDNSVNGDWEVTVNLEN